MGVEYKIKLATPGELSGQLVVAGSASYNPEPPPGADRTVIMPAFMGVPGEIIAENPKMMENLLEFNARPVPARLIKEYGNRMARLIHLGHYSPPGYYNFEEAFKTADIAFVEGKPVIKFFSRPGNAWNEGPRMFGIPCYIKDIFEMYEADYRKGKISWRMMWHVENRGDFVLYVYNTRRLEWARKKMRRIQKKGGFTGGLESYIAKVEQIIQRR